MYRLQQALPSWILSLGAALAGSACSSPAPPPLPQPATPLRLVASIRDLMEGQIDPSADALWDSVAFIATTTGTEDRQPRTEEEWKAVRTSAITLIEAANLLSMPGRRVTVTRDHRTGESAAGMRPANQHQGAESESNGPVGLGELPPAQIQQRIDANHAGFVQFARLLQDAALQALAAIDAQDPQALMDAGGVIDQACEACHVTYWYPNQARPGS